MDVDDYMKLEYPVVTREIVEDNEKYIEASIPELPGLKVYVDDYSEIVSEIKKAKLEWFAAKLELNKNIPLPGDQ